MCGRDWGIGARYSAQRPWKGLEGCEEGGLAAGQEQKHQCDVTGGGGMGGTRGVTEIEEQDGV